MKDMSREEIILLIKQLSDQLTDEELKELLHIHTHREVEAETA